MVREQPKLLEALVGLTRSQSRVLPPQALIRPLTGDAWCCFRKFEWEGKEQREESKKVEDLVNLLKLTLAVDCLVHDSQSATAKAIVMPAMPAKASPLIFLEFFASLPWVNYTM